METALKELAKLEKLTSSSRDLAPKSLQDGKGKASIPISDTLDALLLSLNETMAMIEAGSASNETFNKLSSIIDSGKKELDDRQKEIYNALARYGKGLEKTLPTPLPDYPRMFSSDDSSSALETAIAMHLLRTGQLDIARTLLEESHTDISPDVQSQFEELHRVVSALRLGEIQPALEWAQSHRAQLSVRSSPLEFYLHRSRYMRLLLASDPPNPIPALQYARTALQPFYLEFTHEFKRLTGCIAYLPLKKLQSSPYADLVQPSIHLDLENLFAKEFCANLGMSRAPPLRVVTDIGGSGALARIEMGRKVMRENKSEWTQADELPIEIPLPLEHRYHTVFTCPVSKEQTTEGNPPMLLTCGHVLSKESLHKLGKSNGQVKCPYCPTESSAENALPVHF